MGDTGVAVAGASPVLVSPEAKRHRCTRGVGSPMKMGSYSPWRPSAHDDALLQLAAPGRP